MPFSVSTLRQLNRSMSLQEKVDLISMMIASEENGKAVAEVLATFHPVKMAILNTYHAEVRSKFPND